MIQRYPRKSSGNEKPRTNGIGKILAKKLQTAERAPRIKLVPLPITRFHLKVKLPEKKPMDFVF
jgi:hypothetical protein